MRTRACVKCNQHLRRPISFSSGCFQSKNLIVCSIREYAFLWNFVLICFRIELDPRTTCLHAIYSKLDIFTWITNVETWFFLLQVDLQLQGRSAALRRKRVTRQWVDKRPKQITRTYTYTGSACAYEFSDLCIQIGNIFFKWRLCRRSLHALCVAGALLFKICGRCLTWMHTNVFLWCARDTRVCLLNIAKRSRYVQTRKPHSKRRSINRAIIHKFLLLLIRGFRLPCRVYRHRLFRWHERNAICRAVNEILVIFCSFWHR